jgi:pimeloyl-ACP methyl ester carboxylesterase
MRLMSKARYRQWNHVFIRSAALLCVLLLSGRLAAASLPTVTLPSPRVIELKAADGTSLKATFFAASKRGPGVLLLHQSNRDRKSWTALAAQLAGAGLNTLTLDMRGMGESGGSRKDSERMPDDVDAALEYLTSQPGVDPRVVGVAGAGWLGVLHAVEAARRHPQTVKSLVMLSGETVRSGLTFLHQANSLPELFVFSDQDEYPPTQQAMQLLYAASSSWSKKLIHYPAAHEAPWVWYETADASKVAANGAHGTDLFESHPELPGIIEQWLVDTLLATPGTAASDPLAASQILNDVEFNGGLARARRQLLAARKQDPKAQLWPEISMSIVAQDFSREHDVKTAIEAFKLNELAYPDSADVADNLADAYLDDGQKELARQYAQKSLTLLNTPGLPASTWVNTEQYRGEIRHDAERLLQN